MSQKAKKILIFSTSYLPRIGGGELAIKHITDRLPAHTFHLVTMRRDRVSLAEADIGMVRVFRVGALKILFPFIAAWRARALTKQYGPYDCVLASQASWGGLAACLYKKLYPRVRLVLNLQEGQNLDRQSWIRKILRARIIRAADHITAISSYLRAVAVGNGALPSAVSIIPNGVSKNFFVQQPSTPLSPLSTRRVDSGDSGGASITIISVSRLVRKNGIDTLVYAMPLLPNYKLEIAGSGEQEKELKILVNNLGIAERVVFLGNVPHDALPAVLARSSVFVRPSRSEGLGSAFLEAMAAGVPVVGTPVGGIPDFLKDGKTGLMCAPNDPSSIARAIDKLCDDDNLRATIVSNALELVKTKYNWDAIARQYDQIFQS